MLLFPMRKTYVLLQKLPLFQIHGITGRYNKPSTLWTIPASLDYVVYWRILCSHGTVCTSMFMPLLVYTLPNLFDNIESRSHRIFFAFGHFVNFQVSFCCKIIHDNLKEIYLRGFVYVKICFLIGRNHTTGTRNTYMIIAL